jgi:excisionase family DNA binding protein
MATLLTRAAKKAAHYYNTDNIGEFLTRQQAAGYLKLCRNKVDGLPIPKIRIGRSVRFRKADIDAFMASATQGGAV